MNGRWNNQSPSMGPPPHIQQSQSPTWTTPSVPHGFPGNMYVSLERKKTTISFSFRSRRPNHSNHHQSHGKKDQSNFFPYLPSATNAPIRSTGNFLSSQNGQPSMLNGDMGQTFPSMNVKPTFVLLVLFISLHSSQRVMLMT